LLTATGQPGTWLRTDSQRPRQPRSNFPPLPFSSSSKFPPSPALHRCSSILPSLLRSLPIASQLLHPSLLVYFYPSFGSLSMAESLLYKTPSPVCAKRRLSGIPVRTTTITEGGALGPSERVPNDAVRRIVSSGGDRPGSGDVPWRRGSFSGSSDVLKKLEEETESVDSSMGFRELERV
jgi:hypothetical protein